MVRFVRGPHYTAPAVDSYSLRLVTVRKLYDCGTLVQHAPSIAALAPGTSLVVNPYDLARLGVEDGATVKVTSARAAAHYDVSSSTAVPKGAAVLAVNQASNDPSLLVDATAAITEIRVETL
jgi:anaerobic selenocysteine-containing dehydrogenase